MAKPDKIEKLSDAEIAGVDSYIENDLQDSKTFIQKIHASKQFKNTNVRCEPQLRALEAWQRQVEAGQKKCIKRIDGKLTEVTATMADVDKYTSLDRPFYTDTAIMDDILMRKRCPLDGTLYMEVADAV